MYPSGTAQQVADLENEDKSPTLIFGAPKARTKRTERKTSKLNSANRGTRIGTNPQHRERETSSATLRGFWEPRSLEKKNEDLKKGCSSFRHQSFGLWVAVFYATKRTLEGEGRNRQKTLSLPQLTPNKMIQCIFQHGTSLHRRHKAPGKGRC